MEEIHEPATDPGEDAGQRWRAQPSGKGKEKDLSLTKSIHFKSIHSQVKSYRNTQY